MRRLKLSKSFTMLGQV